jgi:hypothetical protein
MAPPVGAGDSGRWCQNGDMDRTGVKIPKEDGCPLGKGGRRQSTELLQHGAVPGSVESFRFMFVSICRVSVP